MGKKKEEWREKVYKLPEEIDLPDNWEEIKKDIFRRDKYACLLCSKKPRFIPLTVHHIIARRFGGGHDYENLATLCVECHDLIELEDFQLLKDFWSYINQWKTKLTYKKENYIREEAEIDDFHLWVYGGYKRPDITELKKRLEKRDKLEKKTNKKSKKPNK